MEKEQIIKSIQKHFDQDTRIHSIYLSGSHAKNATKFSDIDIRIVCMEESDLLSLIKTLPEELKSLFNQNISYHNATPYHFFFLLP
jgi:predicted nucleotidyltransferase